MKETKSRPEWDAYFLAMAIVASTRSTCIRRRIGAVLVLDNRILATGYNGSPSGTRHCVDIGCLRQQLNVPSGSRHEICRGSHAEKSRVFVGAGKNAAGNNDPFGTNLFGRRNRYKSARPYSDRKSVV